MWKFSTKPQFQTGCEEGKGLVHVFPHNLTTGTGTMAPLQGHAGGTEGCGTTWPGAAGGHGAVL